MSKPNYAILEAMSEQECVARFGGMTRADLKSYLASKKYFNTWQKPLDIGEVFEVDPEADFTLPNTGDTIYQETEDGGHIHLPKGGVIGAHGGAPRWLAHRWFNSGREPDDIRVAVDLEHHATGLFEHFHKARNLAAYVVRYGRTCNNRYVFCKDVYVSGVKVNTNNEGDFTKYRLSVRYKYQACVNKNQTDCRSWQSRSKRKTCKADFHYRSRPHCFIVD